MGSYTHPKQYSPRQLIVGKGILYIILNEWDFHFPFLFCINELHEGKKIKSILTPFGLYSKFQISQIW